MTALELFVPDNPAPKGSPRVVTHGKGGRPLPKPLVLKDSPKTERWERVVAEVARGAMAFREPFSDAELEVTVTFGLARPAGHYGKKGLRPAAPRGPKTKPDLDKLARSSLDAMEGIVFDNDSRIVVLDLVKVYVPTGTPTGALIRVAVASSRLEQRTEQYLAAAGTERVADPVQPGLFPTQETPTP